MASVFYPCFLTKILLLNKNKEQKTHSYLFWDFAGYGGQIAVRMGKWKGIKINQRKESKGSLELYDLEEDISETNSVTKEHPDVAKKIENVI